MRFCLEVLVHNRGFGLGFAVCTEVTSWDLAAHVGEFGWDGAASTHYWNSPADKLIVVTLEQIMPYRWDTARGIKKISCDAIQKCMRFKSGRGLEGAPSWLIIGECFMAFWMAW